jgi:hypothetical protein
MVRDPLAILAIAAPDGDGGAHHLCGHVARHPLLPGRPLALGPVAHQSMGRLLETPIHPLVERWGLACLAPQAPQVPLPRATPQLVGQGMHGFPALPLALIAPTGRDQMERGVGLAMASMRVAHDDGAPAVLDP